MDQTLDQMLDDLVSNPKAALGEGRCVKRNLSFLTLEAKSTAILPDSLEEFKHQEEKKIGLKVLLNL